MENFKIQLDAKDYYSLYDSAKSAESYYRWWKEEEAKVAECKSLLDNVYQELRKVIRDENGIAIKAEHDKIKHILEMLEVVA